MKVFTRIIAILIGAVFIYAGIVKVMEPIAFAKDIDNYKMLSWPVAVALGFFLPWLEIAAGVALVTRWMERGGLLILTGLMTVFIVASLVAKSRGLDISCGCFGHASKDWSFARHMLVDFSIAAGLAFLWWRLRIVRPEAALVSDKPLEPIETR